MLPESLNPMNLIPEELNPFSVGKGLLEDGAKSLAPKISDYVRSQMANQVSGNDMVGQFAQNAAGNLEKITPLMAMSGTRPALNQGIFAPNLPMPGSGNISTQAGILGNIFPQAGIVPTDPIFDGTTLMATGEEAAEEDSENAETEEEKKEREARNKALIDILQQSAKNEQTSQPKITPPTASAGKGAQPIQLTASDMRTIGGNTGGRNNTFGLLGG